MPVMPSSTSTARPRHDQALASAGLMGTARIRRAVSSSTAAQHISSVRGVNLGGKFAQVAGNGDRPISSSLVHRAQTSSSGPRPLTSVGRPVADHIRMTPRHQTVPGGSHGAPDRRSAARSRDSRPGAQDEAPIITLSALLSQLLAHQLKSPTAALVDFNGILPGTILRAVLAAIAVRSTVATLRDVLPRAQAALHSITANFVLSSANLHRILHHLRRFAAHLAALPSWQSALLTITISIVARPSAVVPPHLVDEQQEHEEQEMDDGSESCEASEGEEEAWSPAHSEQELAPAPLPSPILGPCSTEEEVDVDAVWHSEPLKHHLVPLSSEEIKSHRYAFEAGDYAHWYTKTVTFLDCRHPQAALLMRLEPEDAAELVAEYSTAKAANT